MQYKTKVENIINETNIDRESRNRELFEYSREHMKEYDLLSDKNRDGMTHLPGLRGFFYEAGEMVNSHPDYTFGVIVIDIHQFKAVNEFCGRKKGDELLRLISDLFLKFEEERPCTKSGHARADNFLMCTAFKEERELVDIVKYMYHTITTYPFPYKVAPSFGICSENEPLPAVSYLKDCATIALNSIKGKFYSYYAVFDDDMRREILREKQVENDIINALEKGELQLYIQPKFDMRDNSIYGGEALVRWNHAGMGLIAPQDFIPVLEKNGFIIQVDYYVWEQVFKYLCKLRAQGRKLVPISINISRVHVHDEDLYETLTKFALKYDIPPEFVPLEITESAFEYNEKLMFENLRLLKKEGFKISMDDFGTGYSSLQMIATQELDEIKIDRSFLDNIANKKSRIVLKNIIKMLNDLKSDFIIEGVETEEQKDLLLKYGCFHAQGFLFEKPLPADEFDKVLKNQ